jgi:signal peptidase I
MQTKETQKATRAITPELRRRIIALAAKLIGLIVIIYILLFRIYGFVRIDTNIMAPSIEGGDLSLVFHLTSEHAIGDVVYYRHDGHDFVGRVVAKAGDVVNIADNKVTINGNIDDSTSYGENVLPENSSINYPYTVAEKQVFVLGDNRNESDDSRTFGAINESEITGHIIGLFRTHGI